MVTIEFTQEELSALIDMEEDYLSKQSSWNVGDPHPLGDAGDSASNKIRDAFGEEYARG